MTTSVELRTVAHQLIDDLVELRATRGYTQASIGRRIGICRAAVANFEAKRYSPSLEVLLRYATAVGAEITFVMARSCP